MQPKCTRQQIQQAEIMGGVFEAACGYLPYPYEASADLQLDGLLTIIFYEPMTGARLTVEIQKTGLMKSCAWQDGREDAQKCRTDLSSILSQEDFKNSKPRKFK